MAIVPSDMPVQWSTDFETLFLAQYNTTIAVEKARIDPLLMELTLGDHRGNKVTLDWLGAAPQMRKWVDEKRRSGLSNYTWDVLVADYEASIGIDINAMVDAIENPYERRIQEMAQNAGRLTYNLISDLIKGGAAAKCYDGQFFYDTDHSEGESGTQSNKLTGTGTSSAQVKADYYSAMTALCGFKDDKGEPMQVSMFNPIIWIPNNATMVQVFEELQAAPLISNTSNILTNRFTLVIDPRLTDANDWYMFRSDTPMKPFVLVNRQAPTYKDNLTSDSDAVFMRKEGTASVEARAAATYGMWQKAVMVSNA